MLEIDDSVWLAQLQTEDDSGLIGCGLAAPRLSWRLQSDRPGVEQLAYEIEVGASPDFTSEVATSGKVTSTKPFLAPWPATPLKSREKRWWRVRVETDLGWTGWSQPAAVEASLLENSDWVAKPISIASNAGKVERSPVPYLRREFLIAQPVREARLYVTSFGVHEVAINGSTVGQDLLEPGWTVYPDRLLFSSYDVTDLVGQGANAISGLVADGWFRGELTWMDQRGVYGDTTGLLAQLEITLEDGQRVIVATDETWRGSYGAMHLAEIYDGVDLDFRCEPQGWQRAGFNDVAWESAIALPMPNSLQPRISPAVQVIQVSPPYSIIRGKHVTRVDAGQNLAGYLRITVRGAAGDEVTVRHAELLDNGGRLHTLPLRHARATDKYILADDAPITLEPQFTFHGFRYAEIEAPASVVVETIEVVAVGSALDYTGSFECSNLSVNRLFQNALWSQRGNFVALPTDCPQRDERLGWTGDIQVFSETACFNADCRSFLSNWLIDLALEQRGDGNVTGVVPNVIKGHRFEYGGVGWGDAATLVPWALYQAYGDLGVLAKQYDSMKSWVDYCASRRNADGVWTGDFQLGDWLDPAAPADKPELATTDSDYVATCYLSYSAGRLGDAARLLSKNEDADRYTALSREVAGAAWRCWADHAVKTQTGCAMAIMFGIAPAETHPAIGLRLAEHVIRNNGKIATGFLGTPLILPALTATGQVEAAYLLLLNRECPGWLFQVERGATTMWERWDAINENGTLHSGTMNGGATASMISYNHYAYGAVAAWLYKTVAGIATDPEDPGYGTVIFAPQPGGGITRARASLVTPYGVTSTCWNSTPDGISVTIEIPAGAKGRFVAPAHFILDGDKSELAFGSGSHELTLYKHNTNVEKAA